MGIGERNGGNARNEMVIQGISMGTQRIWVEMQKNQGISVAIQEIQKIRMEMQEVRLAMQVINVQTYSRKN